MFIVVTLMKNVAPGLQMLFAFVAPGLWIWWRERHRSQKRAKIDAKQAIEVPTPAIANRQASLAPDASATTYPTHTIPTPQSKEQKATAQLFNRQDARVEKERAFIRERQISTEEVQSSAKAWAKPSVPAPPNLQTRNRQGWIAKGENIVIAGREIAGMVYVGTPPLLNNHGYRDKCRAFIDPSLSVARLGSDPAGGAMPYWPGYSDIPAQCRATYLDWLADGRSNATYNPGYMFLYFYGLERRFIIDQPSNDEKHDILKEVMRLAQLFSGNGSVERYLGEFIQIAQMSLNDAAVHEPVFDHRGWDLPFSLKVAIGARIDRGDHLTAEWVLSWLLCHPERRIRTAAERCDKEFKALFKLKFDARFTDGLKVAKPRKMLKGTYQAASREFQAQLAPEINGKLVPDISSLRKPVEIAQEIADQAMDDLDKLSRYLGRNPEDRDSLEAQALLPSDLRQLFPSAELEALKAWAENIVVEGGLAPVSDVISRLEGAHPDKLSKRQLTSAADALARIGFGFAPDPRFALRAPALGEPIVLFRLGTTVDQLEDVSTTYRASLVELALGSFVAHADGKIADAERKSLLERIAQTEGLTEQERRRLFANLEWLLAIPPDLSLLRKKLKETGPESQSALRAALVSAAHADGAVQSEEVAGIEKIYKALGLDPALVYSDLHAGDARGGPIRVKAAEPGAPGEAIPAEKVAALQPLDAARIAAIRTDTERVSTVLEEIFASDLDDDHVEGMAPSVLKSLDQRHAGLVRDLICQEHWTQDAFDALCKQFGVMSSGTLEAVNEWAFETYDEALLDEYEGFDVAPDIAAALKLQFEKEGQHVQTETA